MTSLLSFTHYSRKVGLGECHSLLAMDRSSHDTLQGWQKIMCFKQLHSANTCLALLSLEETMHLRVERIANHTGDLHGYTQVRTSWRKSCWECVGAQDRNQHLMSFEPLPKLMRLGTPVDPLP
ncbi:hypothetical protein Ancab_000108 [Ancistrocladus abbreviatus]